METKERLDALRAQRPVPHAKVEYTIGGTTETHVHMTHEAGLTGQINRGDKVMQSAAQRFRDNMLFKSQLGRARGQFKHVARKITPRDLADKNSRERDLSRNR